ncbi:MAG: hypothetical protein V4660_05030 [Pseudomonadota bacterium]
MPTRKKNALAVIGLIFISTQVRAEFDASIGYEARVFTEKKFSGLGESAALLFEIDYSTSIGDNQAGDAKIDVLYDEIDENRRFVNVAELKWSYYAGQWEYRLGVDTVFWGVVESENIVDIINPRNIAADPEGDTKLGQAMINMRYSFGSSTVDAYILPGFREPIYADFGEILSPLLPIGEATYESSSENQRIDSAVRFATIMGDLDIALSHFSGNSRVPIFKSGLINGGVDGVRLGLIPNYYVIDQTGLELQYLSGNSAYKLEAISRHEDSERYAAAVFGIEYTSTGVLGTKVDVGWVGEYLFDDRGNEAPGFYEHDYAVAARINFNSPNSAIALLKAVYDPHSGETIFALESSFRFSQNILISFDSQFIDAKEPEIQKFSDVLELLNSDDDKLSQFNHHDYIQLRVDFYY